jgi:hypothetical protein
MESKRRTQIPYKQTPPPPAIVRPGAIAPPGFFTRHGNTILTVALLIAAAVLAGRWWSRSADAARSAVVQQLETARESVDQLRSPGLLMSSNGAPLPSADVMARVRMLQGTASGLLSDVINKADAPAIKARALVVRGDLAWAVANLPELPGAATQPALRPDPPADVLLGQAADAYNAVLTAGGADKEAIASAHLGLAAVAENRGDWATARQQLQAVADDPDGIAVLSQSARTELAGLPALQQPVYLAPPTGVPVPPPPPSVPTTRAVMGPLLPTTLPTSMPTSMPAMMPTSLPTSQPGA